MSLRPLACLAALALVACDETSATPPPGNPSDAAADAADAVVDAPDASPPPQPIRATAPFLRYADPRVGTGGLGFGTGSAFPGPQRPFGLARPGPDTVNSMGDAIVFAHCAGYADIDTHIGGFSQMHMHGTGIVDYGALGFMPTVGMSAAKTSHRGYLAPFSHARETMAPGYYAVTLGGTEVRTEITAADHTSLYRVTFPAGSDGYLLFDVGHALSDVHITGGSVEVDAAAGEVRGSVRLEGGYSDRIGGVEMFYVARLSRPLAGAGVWQAGALAPAGTSRTGRDVGAYVPVDTRASAQVTVAIGISLTDVAHARMNLMAEAADLDFDRVRGESERLWESLLARSRFEARSERELRMLYSAAYRTLLMPTLASDVDGSYRGVDRVVQRAEGFRYYTDLSLWDTFRTEHPWLTLVYPEYQRDFVRSAIAMGEVLGYFPRWPLATGETGGMLGDCGALMVADTYLRGLRGFDVARAYAIARRSAFAAPTRREALDDYMSLGYVPAEGRGSSTSATLEYAYADGALAQMAAGLGHADDAATLTARAGSYRNAYDPAQGFMAARRRDGGFMPIGSANAWTDWYAEGDAWQYLWYAPHDLGGLATLLGGRARLLERLDEFFMYSMDARRTGLPEQYYWHGNEPDIHAPWIPSFFDDAATASRYVQWVRSTRYTDGPDGIPGNDDAGTMSAWYLFAALGAYPIAGTDTWLLAAPMVTRAEVTLADGATLVVRAPDADGEHLNPRAITWNDAALARPRMTHAQIARGGTLAFDLAR